VVKDHPTSPISLHTAPRERSGLKEDLNNWQTPCFHREARDLGLHWASPWSAKSPRVTANQGESTQSLKSTRESKRSIGAY
jgi:hypothetical protein